MIDADPALRPEQQPEDNDRALRPQGLSEFIGQAEARANLKVFIQSARLRNEAMDHTLLKMLSKRSAEQVLRFILRNRGKTNQISLMNGPLSES